MHIATIYYSLNQINGEGNEMKENQIVQLFACDKSFLNFVWNV